MLSGDVVVGVQDLTEEEAGELATLLEIAIQARENSDAAINDYRARSLQIGRAKFTTAFITRVYVWRDKLISCQSQTDADAVRQNEALIPERVVIKKKPNSVDLGVFVDGVCKSGDGGISRKVAEVYREALIKDLGKE